jgi:nucleoside-diphosphate-sugar epimerase
VLVTGVTGLIGSSVADALISRGFKVRGVTRDVTKVGLFKEKLENLYGDGVIEFVQVEYASQADAYKSALQGESRWPPDALQMSSPFPMTRV